MSERLSIAAILAVPIDKDDDSLNVTLQVLTFTSSSPEESDDIIDQYIGTLFSPVAWTVTKASSQFSYPDIQNTLAELKYARIFSAGLVLMLPQTAETKYHLSALLLYATSEQQAKTAALSHAAEHFPLFEDFVLKMEELPSDIYERIKTSNAQ
ncbi:MAG: hypothetical protein COU47_02850 [Candidatus Niyogibacteria bacterium CG10_big_fil_rev_8_21_14_0_10_46_36]|uniref:Uncharacterized protein n=1 Tax=Candidatus Niyogibacteria bacterium CG10_big_fil_rev_8_21_14_0_10_46_36 TaxID=1974726 RepID=A0A2H0TD49_9BACT|nr:MAG: hypothetical protein COU47_02850 [Candidatus Niyogibacteria bacterium CG10_big_fil_rev_8_21_14_0_10_46_36]